MLNYKFEGDSFHLKSLQCFYLTDNYSFVHATQLSEDSAINVWIMSGHDVSVGNIFINNKIHNIFVNDKFGYHYPYWNDDAFHSNNVNFDIIYDLHFQDLCWTNIS